MKNFEELNAALLKDADKKKLAYYWNRWQEFSIFTKASEELEQAIITRNTELTADAIGDVLLSLCIIADQHNLPIVSCLRKAFDKR
jgi:NTP pyrophosphatase (non-canonical NTP hydrolase)